MIRHLPWAPGPWAAGRGCSDAVRSVRAAGARADSTVRGCAAAHLPRPSTSSVGAAAEASPVGKSKPVKKL